MTTLDVIICTYNRASELDRALAALATQQGSDRLLWSVLVVDNGSKDDTAGVVEAWRIGGGIPGLRRVVELKTGLTAARRRGVRETNGSWIAFVDDDNLLAPDWIHSLAEAIAAHAEAGGFGGKIIIEWSSPRPDYLEQFGWCFAEQDYGAETREIDNLAGAGMVLQRQALEASGWVDRPLVEDRTGSSLVSGGDVEMVQRVRGRGYKLWYLPQCKLSHRISAERMTRRHLLILNFGLGRGAAAINAIGWSGTYETWIRNAKSNKRLFAWRSLQDVRRWLGGREGVMVGLAGAAFAIGFARGVAAVKAMPCLQRVKFVGAALRSIDKPLDGLGAYIPDT
jgi:glycosyltransferase involved in cell wall biosynthesis